jgi:hypothetical protein
MKEMRSILMLFIANLMVITSLFAQAPERVNYQAVARDLAGVPITNTGVNLTFEILQGSASGTISYSESQTKTTNQFGLFTAEIGSGTVISGSFPGIAWGSDTYYLRITVNGDVMPATQLLSVPYALYSKTSGNGPAGADGVGIDSTQLNADGTLTIFYSNTTSYTTTDITGTAGIDGVDGIGINWLGSLAAAPAAPNLNDAYYDIAQAKSFIWDGTGWQQVAQDGASSTYTAGTGIDVTTGVISNTGDRDSTNELITSAILNGTTLEFTEDGVVHSVSLASLSNDGDSSAINEIQDLSWNSSDSNFINISSGGIGIALSSNTPSTNQVLTWNGANWVAQNSGSGADNWGTEVVNVSGANISGDGTILDPIVVTESDPSPTNEIQVLSANLGLIADTINLSNGGGTIILPNSTGDNWGSQLVNVDGITIFGDGNTIPLSGFDGQYTSLTGSPTNVSSLTNDAGYLTTFTEIDGSITNEIQDLSTSGNTINISGGTGTTISAVAPTTGEYLYWNGLNWVSQPVASGFDGQYSSLIGSPTNVSSFTNDMGYINTPDDADPDPLNEVITNFSFDGINLNVTEAGTPYTVDLSGLSGPAFSPGTGIDLSGGIITNTSLNTDDQQLTYNSGTQTLSLTTSTTPQNVILNVNDADFNPTNEMVTSFGLNGANLELIDGGGTYSVPLTSLGGTSLWTDAGADTYLTSLTDQVGIGTTTPSAMLEVTDDILVNSIIIGKGAGNLNGNVVFGEGAFVANSTGTNNTAIGNAALQQNTDGGSNVALGFGALGANTTANGNVGLGRAAMPNTSSGFHNVGVGDQVMFNNSTGFYNVAIGKTAMLTNATGNRITTIGVNSDVGSGNLSNATAIGADAVVNTSNSLVLGNNANVGIGTSSPAAKLEVDGTIRFSNPGSAFNTGYVLTTTSTNGDAEWQPVPGTTGSVTVHSDVTNAGSGSIITAAERGKLTGIEPSADVTDAANVLAAGAVMTSGDQTIAGDKTFVGSTTFADGTEGVGKVLTSDATGNASWKVKRVAFEARGATMSIDNTPVLYQLDAVNFDEGGNFNPASGQYSFTAPANGVYSIKANILFNHVGGPDDITVVEILVNGGMQYSSKMPIRAADRITNTIGSTMRLSANDKIQVQVYVISGGGAITTGGGDESWFSGHLIYAD